MPKDEEPLRIPYTPATAKMTSQTTMDKLKGLENEVENMLTDMVELRGSLATEGEQAATLSDKAEVLGAVAVSLSDFNQRLGRALEDVEAYKQALAEEVAQRGDLAAIKANTADHTNELASIKAGTEAIRETIASGNHKHDEALQGATQSFKSVSTSLKELRTELRDVVKEGILWSRDAHAASQPAMDGTKPPPRLLPPR